MPLPQVNEVADRLKKMLGKSAIGQLLTGGVTADSKKFVIPEFSYLGAKQLIRSNGLIATLVEKSQNLVVGTSFYFTVDSDKNELEKKAKETLEAYCRLMGFGDLKDQIHDELVATGNAYGEKVWTEYSEGITDPAILAKLKLKGLDPKLFVRVPKFDTQFLGLKRVLPSEYMSPISLPNGEVIAYQYLPSATPVYYLADEIVHFRINVPAGQNTGVGLVEAIFKDVKRLERIISLLPLIVENYAEPRRIWKAPTKTEAKDFANYMTTVQHGDEPVLYSGVEHVNTETQGNSKFMDYIELLVDLASERFHLPRNVDLENSNLSSSKEQRKDAQPFIAKLQIKLVEKLTNEVFALLLMNHKEFVEEKDGKKTLKVKIPALNWGVPTTGFEGIDRQKLLEIAVGQGKVNVVDLLKKTGLPVEESEESPEAEKPERGQKPDPKDEP